MKKIVTAACALVCAAFLCACAVRGDKKTDMDSGNAMSEETAALDDGQEGAAEQKASNSGGHSADEQDGGEDKNGQDALADMQMQVLSQGKFGGVGLGSLVCGLPGQNDEDYKLCFFQTDDKSDDFTKPLQQLKFSFEEADYVFPDVQENNVPIGRFIEIYYSDSIAVGTEGTPGIAVVASYDVNGTVCYDTRIYKWDGTGYIPDQQLMREINEKYRDAQEYPVQELYLQPLGTESQDIQESAGGNESAQG